jgi:hypothetical protein
MFAIARSGVVRFHLACIVGIALFTNARAAGPAALSLTEKVDGWVEAGIKARKGVAAPLADDAEFCRRVYLDLTGRIPSLTQVRDFLGNPAKDKRPKLVETLLNSNRFPTHFANVWRALLLPDTANPTLVYYRPAIENWLRREFANNSPYDKMVRTIVTGGTGTTDAAALQGFLLAGNNQPDRVAAMTSRLFLGVKIECAQCHNHPFAKWNRKDFWEFAAFFNTQATARFNKRGGIVQALPLNEIPIPGTNKVAKAHFLGHIAPPASVATDPRGTVADWITNKDNPYFAKATVNRLWEYFLGTGLVDPVDEFDEENPASHPQVIDLLAKEFTAKKFDLRVLIKAITATKAYQRTSRQTHASQADRRMFGRMRVRGLSPEQLWDSLEVATGKWDDDDDEQRHTYVNPIVSAQRTEFLLRFPNQDKRTEQQMSILQALYLMNGKLVDDATSLEKNQNLAILAAGGSVPMKRRVQQLFLITLGRKPTAQESGRFVRFIDKGGATNNSEKAFCDVFWALLNSSEFCVNH